jgi:trans-aconitate methyltransferase
MDLRERTQDANEPRHPWERARARLVVDLLKGTPAGAVLDVGAGDAYVARALVDADPSAHVTALDAHYTNADLAAYRAPRLEPVRALAEAPERVDTALLLDVLEHVQDDDALLRDVVARVRPGGRVVVTVPAWPRLYAAHDVALGHVRRYTPTDARALLGRAGLDVVRAGGAFFSLLAPRVASRALEKVRATEPSSALDDPRMRGPLGRVVDAVLRADVRAARVLSTLGVDAPGLSFFALCRRPA